MPLGAEKVGLLGAAGVATGNYFGDGSLGVCQFGASSITQTGDSTAIDTVLSTGSEAGGPGTSSYGYDVPNESACYEGTVLSTDGDYDGDMVLMQFDTLTIDASVTLTTDQPCRGLFVYVKNDCTINGALSMTARGGFSDPTASGGSDSNAVAAGGLQLSVLTSGGSDSFTNDGTGFNGAGTTIRTAIANQTDISSDGTTFTISKLGGAAIPKSAGSSCSPVNGYPGNNGVTGAVTISTGGGGTGGSIRADCGSTGYGGGGGAAGAFGGGSGGGASGRSAGDGSNVGVDFGGGGGTAQGFNSGSGSSNGSGNPPGTNTSYSGAVGNYGTGGIIWLIVGGDLTIGSGATIEAKGVIGGSGAGSGASGGSTGGGAIMALYVGTLTNNGAIEVDGGPANTTGADGGAGGTGGKHTAQIE